MYSTWVVPIVTTFPITCVYYYFYTVLSIWILMTCQPFQIVRRLAVTHMKKLIHIFRKSAYLVDLESLCYIQNFFCQFFSRHNYRDRAKMIRQQVHSTIMWEKYFIISSEKTGSIRCTLYYFKAQQSEMVLIYYIWSLATFKDFNVFPVYTN